MSKLRGSLVQSGASRSVQTLFPGTASGKQTCGVGDVSRTQALLPLLRSTSQGVGR